MCLAGSVRVQEMSSIRTGRWKPSVQCPPHKYGLQCFDSASSISYQMHIRQELSEMPSGRFAAEVGGSGSSYHTFTLFSSHLKGMSGQNYSWQCHGGEMYSIAMLMKGFLLALAALAVYYFA